MTTPSEIIDAAVQSVAYARQKDWEDVVRPLAQSPIEELFLAAVYASNIDWGDSPVHIYMAQYTEDATRFEGDHLWTQAQIGSYRVDFLFERIGPRDTRRVIVECDGHDWHEKTKEQATSDKARDRYLVAKGFKVLRFTGSELYRDPVCCWAEARNVLWGLAEAA